MKKIIASILAVFFVLLSPLSAYASTTESIITYASNDVNSVQPRGLYDNYSLTLFASKLNTDTSASNAFPSRSNGNAFNLVDGTNTLSLSGISTNINLSDTYLGFGFSLTNSNPYGIGVPPLFNYDMFIDFSVMRQFFNIDNQQFNVAVGAIPQISFADVSIQYTYRILNSSGSLVTKDGSETLRLPMEVYFDNFFSNGGGHGAHVKIHGFQFDDLKKFQQYGYFNDLTLEDVQSFTCSTISVNGYAYYSLSDYFNFLSEKSK